MTARVLSPEIALVASIKVEAYVSESFRPGDRIRIRAFREVSTATLVHGITGEIVGHSSTRSQLV